MAKQDAGFVDKHIEKVAVTLCVAVLVGAAGLNFVVGRFKVDDMTVPALVEKAGEEAQRAASAIQGARPAPPRQAKPDSTDDPIEALGRSFGPDRAGLDQFAGLSTPWPRTQMFPPSFVPVVEKSADEKHYLAELVQPGPPVVSAGRSSFRIPEQVSLERAAERRDSEDERANAVTRNWVSVASQIDLVDQNTNYKERSYAKTAAFDVVRVELQRLDLTEPWRGWENVDTYLPFKPITPDLVTSTEKRDLLTDAADLIARTPLPERRGGDKVEVPPVPFLDEPPPQTKDMSPTELEAAATRNVSKWTRMAQDALAGKRQFKGRPDVDAAYILASAAAATTTARTKEVEKARSVLNEVMAAAKKANRDYSNRILRQPKRLMPIMAHDLDVVPGHSYVYRIRYEVRNIFAGASGQLRNEADADKVTLVSDWSQPSLPVRVDTSTYFFLTSANRKTGEAVVTVCKKTRRGTDRKEFSVRVGDKIGKKETRGKKTDFSTDAICIGIDFDGKRDVVLTYLDESDGSIGQRVLSRDRQSKLLEELSK